MLTAFTDRSRIGIVIGPLSPAPYIDRPGPVLRAAKTFGFGWLMSSNPHCANDINTNFSDNRMPLSKLAGHLKFS
jgi:hypothetical protein